MPKNPDIKKVLVIGSGPIVIGPVSYTHLYCPYAVQPEM